MKYINRYMYTDGRSESQTIMPSNLNFVYGKIWSWVDNVVVILYFQPNAPNQEAKYSL